MKSIYHNRDKKIDEIWASRGKVVWQLAGRHYGIC